MTYAHNSKFSEIYSAWEKMIACGEIDYDIIRPDIAESWQRCYQAGVDPEGGDSHLLLSLEEHGQMLEENQDLLDIARPIIDKLYQMVAGSGFIVLLADKRGYIMHSLGDEETMKTAININLIERTNWIEQEVGTNGLGTALALKKPVQVSGPEHYCRGLHFWTCSTAPIFGEDGEIMGALQLSGPSELAYAHTLGMVVSTVQAIEDQFKLKRKNLELTVLNQQLVSILATMSDGVITIDKNGMIKQVNTEARRILNHSPSEINELMIDDLLDINPYNKNMLCTGKPYSDIEVIVDKGSNSFHCLASGRPLKDDQGKVMGGVVVLAPIKHVKRLVNRISGAHACFHFSDIIGADPDLLEAIRISTMAASNDSNVLITGESGTGKELFAQAIHNHSSRRCGPFVAINCGAIPRELVGSELMGYVEGAFTGADRKGRPGKFELATDGTLFLDEIGDMPMEQQITLLRILQDRKVTRIGSNKVIPVDVRIICATNKNLLSEVARGNFRSDLYYRLNVISVSLPPLRNRREDIPVFFNHFLNNICQKRGLPPKQIDPLVMDYLKQYDWPGNVRELQNVVERIVNLGGGQKISLDHLPEEIISSTALSLDSSPTLACPSDGTISSVRKKHKVRLAQKEREEIIKLLIEYGGNISNVAKYLDVSRNTVYRKIKQYNIALE